MTVVNEKRAKTDARKPKQLGSVRIVHMSVLMMHNCIMQYST